MSLDMPSIKKADQSIVIRHSRRKLLFLSLGSLALVLGSLWMLSNSHSSQVYYEGLAATIFSGLGLLVSLFLLFTSSLLLTIDDEGIHCFFPFWRPLMIRWEEIYSIYPIKLRFSDILVITVSPSGKPTYIARNFKPGKIPFTLRKDDGPKAVISLSLSSTILSYTKIIALMQERYAAQVEQYQIFIQAK